MLRFQGTQLFVAVILLLFSAKISATPTHATRSITSIEDVATHNKTNYNCPQNCDCVLHIKTHTKYLHANCSSVESLLDEVPLEPEFAVHSIDLSHLRLTRLSHIFNKLPNLTTINLSYNELHEIGHLGRRIKRLNLKHNRITSNKLVKLPPNLQVLNLQHNDITYLPLEFKELKQLSLLELSHNDINCSCETLEVRNWLQENHVFMENPVICAYPAEAKGKSWLQVKQSDICDKEKQTWHMDDEENDLMLGDQPMESVTDNEDEEELGKAYLPVENKIYAVKTNEQHISNFEGSGDINEPNMELHAAEQLLDVTTQSFIELHDYTEEGSGSGDGFYVVPALHHEHITTDHDYFVPGSVQAGLKDNVNDSKPLEEPNLSVTPSPVIFEKFNLGIFEATESTKTDKPVNEDTIVPVVHHVLETDAETDAPTGSEPVNRANVAQKEDSNATYLLLAVVALLVLGLILFVFIKRCNKKNRQYDAEALRQTELMDMDKQNLGKPLQRNGNEHSPLIGEKTILDQAKPINGAAKKPYDTNDVKDGSGQQLLNGNGKQPTAPAENESLPATTETQAHEYHPITPRYPTPKSPRASKYAQYPPNVEHNNNTNHDDAYLAASPKSGRYSPVYSPETGRVKIKLTETPRPKTPMLVTRSRSNAGDIITTPVHLTKETVGANGNVQY